MDRDTMVARIQEKLGFKQTLAPNIQSALQDEQDELERGATLPWFLLQEDQTFTITPPVPAVSTPQQYNLPTGFISEADDQDGNLRVQLTTPGPQTFVQKMDYRVAEEFFFGQRQVWWDGAEVIVQSATQPPTPGQPKVYVLRKNQVRIYPGPDKVYNMLWTFYAHDARLDGSNVTNQWSTNIPWLLIGRAGLKMAMSTRDKDAASAFQQILQGSPGFAGAEKTYLAMIYDREIGGRRYNLGARL
jgi:hypothetical protein